LHYNAPASYLNVWKGAGNGTCAAFVSLVNNHALDQDLSGLTATRRAVLGAGLVPVGGPERGDEVGYRSFRAGAAEFALEVRGCTYGVNRAQAAIPGIPLIERGRAADNGSLWRVKANRALPTTRIMMAHWGYEYEYWPSTAQRDMALQWIAQGCDMIVGSSPHVLQPFEIVSINGADPRCPSQVRRAGPPGFAMIFWSLGNLATIMPTLPCRVGALAELDIVFDANGGLGFSRLAAVPTYSARGLRTAKSGLRIGIEGAAVSVQELANELGQTRVAARAQAHAEHILGNVAQKPLTA
jgi:poly-gamma-glutamate capsule biosynthesis protein CapA/YwtB (metallophosphatase superfamily)